MLITTTNYTTQEYSSLPFTSQNKQDEYILENFFKKPDGSFIDDGFFIEIGAYDGKLYSNTYALEFLGWKGICIEPLPHIFSQLQKNRTALCIQGCITNKQGTALFREVINEGDMLLSGLAEKYNHNHINLIENHYGAESIYYEVPCFLLSDIIQQYSIKIIHFLSLDTEGNELEILESLTDAELKHIYIVCVEDNYRNPKLVSFMESKNFSLITRIDQDIIFRNNNLKID